jgi:glycosyltransferase involved in cell wall biosynthesis
MAYGLPVVTTSIGAEGMGLTDGEHVLIADDEVSFADKVIALYQNEALWRRLSEQGRRQIETVYSPEVLMTNLDGVFKGLMGVV